MTKLVALAAAIAALACAKKSDPPGGGSGRGASRLQYPVDVAALVPRKMQYTVNAPGALDAFQTVQITARVQGAVDRVTFVEGQEVKAGDVLATIESDRYAIAVEQAKATLAKTEAGQKAAEQALKRRLDAQEKSPGIVAGEEIETKQAAVDSAKADVSAAHEALHVAQLNLRDSQVRVPALTCDGGAKCTGIVQTRTVQQGQFLQPGAVLATIIQRDPLLVRFQVTEQDAPRLKKDMPLTVQLKEAKRTYGATIKLVGGAADPTTRMVPITAQVDKTDTTEHGFWLRPGAFCEVSVPVGTVRDGIVVPSLAVLPTEKGNVVYVVDDKAHVVHARTVQLGMHTADGGVELTKGVTAGEVIVVRGIEPLTEGAPIKVGATVTLDDAQKLAGSGAGSAAAVGSGSGAGSGSAAGPDAAAESGSDRRAGSGGHHRQGSAQ